MSRVCFYERLTKCAATAVCLCVAYSLGTSFAEASNTFAYVSFKDGTVAQYRVSQTGEFVPLSPASVHVDKDPIVFVDPKGRFAYVSGSRMLDDDHTRNTISQFRIEQGGTLAPLNPPAVFTNDLKYPRSVDPFPQFGVFDHSGRYLYVALTSQEGKVAQFAVQSDGTLSALSPPVVEAGHSPGRIVIHPTKPFVFVGNRYDSSISRYSIGKGGTLTPLYSDKSMDFGGSDLTFSADGRYLYSTADRYQTLEQYGVGDDGTLTEVSNASYASEEDICCGVSTIALEPGECAVYVTDSFAGNLYRFDRKNGNGKLTQNASSTYKMTLDNKAETREELRASVASKVKATGYEAESLLARDAEHRAIQAITADVSGVTRGPDGAFYVITSTGVTRLEKKGSTMAPSARASAVWASASSMVKTQSVKAEPNRRPLSIAIVARDEQASNLSNLRTEAKPSPSKPHLQ